MSGAVEALGTSLDRPVRDVEDEKAASVLLSRARPRSSSSICPPLGLEGSGPLCLSPLQDLGGSHQEVCGFRRVKDDVNRPLLAVDRVVHRGHDIPGGLPKDASHESRSSQTAPLREVPQKPPHSESDCIQTIEKLARTRGFSRPVARAIASARRASSNAVYQSKWANFRRWCKIKGISSTTTSVSQIADFLFYLRKEQKLAVPTIKGYRSMLSAVFRHRGLDLTDNKDLHDLLRSFETTKVAQPRLPSWNLDIVLKFLMSSRFEPLDSATLKDVTRKTVFLTALATAKRVSEVQAISKHIGFRGHNAVCSLSPLFLAKNENPSTPWPRTFEIKGMTEILGQEPERVLCPVRALKFYLQRTEECQGPSDNLWCSVKRPDLPLSKNALAFFLRSTILDAHSDGQDSDMSLWKVKAHKVRAVATSVAFQRNMSLNDILGATFWRSSSVFASHYLTDVKTTYENCCALGPYVSADAILGAESDTHPIL
ncbi:uncharacterized protein [Macrobrachium rosenbergii]|uniref:uncharacterized protein n=1 Tax=Macrobrachium rosenbergii TaxID=79674 RepID=UPI0034D3E1CE